MKFNVSFLVVVWVLKLKSIQLATFSDTLRKNGLIVICFIIGVFILKFTWKTTNNLKFISIFYVTLKCSFVFITIFLTICWTDYFLPIQTIIQQNISWLYMCGFFMDSLLFIIALNFCFPHYTWSFALFWNWVMNTF